MICVGQFKRVAETHLPPRLIHDELAQEILKKRIRCKFFWCWDEEDPK